MKKKISLFPLALLIIAAIDSIRNLPSSALFGTALIFFFCLAAVMFLFPTTLVSAELTSAYPEQGGIFNWVTLAYGEKTGMVAIWLQWINTMVWYPTILSFIAGSVAYLIDPELANSRLYLATMIIGLYWALTLITLKGMHFSAKVNAICAMMGTIIPLTLLILLGVVWIMAGKPISIHFTSTDILPNLNHGENWISLTAIMASFLGMELAGAHIVDVKNPKKNFPKVLLFAAIFILVSMVLGSLAIAIVLPAKQINLVSGVFQVFDLFLTDFHLKWLLPVLALSILIGSFGGIITWQTSPARGLSHAAELGYLPSYFTIKNKAGMPYHIMVVQAFLVSLICLAFLLMPSVNGFYWFLTALSTSIYMMMYIMLFFAAIKLRRKRKLDPTAFTIPGKKVGLYLTCCMGLLGCLMTITVGFFPPSTINVGNPLHYSLYMAASMLITLLSVSIFFIFKKFTKKRRRKSG